MYEKLITDLNNCLDSLCGECKYESLMEAGNYVRCMNALIKEAADAIEYLSRQKEYWELEAAAQETDKNYLIDENRKLVEAWQNALYFHNRWISVYDRLPPAEKEVYVTDGEYIARANLLDEVFPGDKPCWSYSGLGEITHWCERIPLQQSSKEGE